MTCVSLPIKVKKLNDDIIRVVCYFTLGKGCVLLSMLKCTQIFIALQ